jgi:hypothetical protein
MQNQKLVKSIHSCQPKAGVIQTSGDIGKAHGSELKMDTKEGEGCSFVILLNDIL